MQSTVSMLHLSQMTRFVCVLWNRRGKREKRRTTELRHQQRNNTFPYWACCECDLSRFVFVIAVNEMCCSAFWIWFEHLYQHAMVLTERTVCMSRFVCRKYCAHNLVVWIEWFDRICVEHTCFPLFFGFYIRTHWSKHSTSKLLAVAGYTQAVRYGSSVVYVFVFVLRSCVIVYVLGVLAMRVYSKPFFTIWWDLSGESNRKQQTSERGEIEIVGFVFFHLAQLLARWHVLV